MANKVVSHFHITPDDLIPLSPGESPPFPKQVTYAEGEPSAETQKQMNSMVEQRADALLKAWASHTPIETGWLTITIQEFDEHDAEYQRLLASAPKVIDDMKRQDPAMYERFQQGGGFQPAMTLAKMRERLGGDEGFWSAPQVRFPVPVSLAEWAEADPETTRLSITSALLLTRDDLELPS